MNVVIPLAASLVAFVLGAWLSPKIRKGSGDVLGSPRSPGPTFTATCNEETGAYVINLQPDAGSGYVFMKSAPILYETDQSEPLEPPPDGIGSPWKSDTNYSIDYDMDESRNLKIWFKYEFTEDRIIPGAVATLGSCVEEE